MSYIRTLSFVIRYFAFEKSLKFFERGAGKTFSKKSFPRMFFFPSYPNFVLPPSPFLLI
jgi:hypothetical protein